VSQQEKVECVRQERKECGDPPPQERMNGTDSSINRQGKVVERTAQHQEGRQPSSRVNSHQEVGFGQSNHMRKVEHGIHEAEEERPSHMKTELYYLPHRRKKGGGNPQQDKVEAGVLPRMLLEVEVQPSQWWCGVLQVSWWWCGGCGQVGGDVECCR
jgi:hypothetical protein